MCGTASFLRVATGLMAAWGPPHPGSPLSSWRVPWALPSNSVKLCVLHMQRPPVESWWQKVEQVLEVSWARLTFLSGKTPDCESREGTDGLGCWPNPCRWWLLAKRPKEKKKKKDFKDDCFAWGEMDKLNKPGKSFFFSSIQWTAGGGCVSYYYHHFL